MHRLRLDDEDMTGELRQGASVSLLFNVHAGETIYIIGSGPTLDHIPRSFFFDKTTIGINETFRDWPLSFLVAHHSEHLQEAIDQGIRVVASEWHNGFMHPQEHMDASARLHFGRNRFAGRYWTYKHRNQTYDVNDIDLSPIIERRTDELFLSCCTPATALHFAAHLGACNIILCGLDGGTLDTHVNYRGYNNGGATSLRHIAATRRILYTVADCLRTTRGVFIGSLNPFCDPTLEGHVYEAL